jgi:hypothetical protein
VEVEAAAAAASCSNMGTGGPAFKGVANKNKPIPVEALPANTTAVEKIIYKAVVLTRASVSHVLDRINELHKKQDRFRDALAVADERVTGISSYLLLEDTYDISQDLPFRCNEQILEFFSGEGVG